MRKIAFLIWTATMLLTMTSCHKSSDPVPNLSPVVVDNARTLFVMSNVPADITYAGVTVKNTSLATFRDAAAKGNLTITPVSDEYLGQEEQPIDFNDRRYLAINVELVKKASLFVSQDDAKNGILVTNDQENRFATKIAASIFIDNTTTITGNTTDPFSIVIYVPAKTIVPTLETNKELRLDVLAALCTPDGAKFSKPVPLTLTIPNSSGYDIRMHNSENEAETVDMTDNGDDTWSAGLNHFSEWDFSIPYEVIAITRSEEYFSGTADIKVGSNVIPYKVKTGPVVTSALGIAELDAIIAEKVAGAYMEFTNEATFTSDAPGIANYRVTQYYADCILSICGKQMSARYYFDATFEITNVLPAEQEGHSGGAGN